ncbi:MAG: asparagine synthetase B, partial [Pyrinomonadaceae bacterium]|nr:asparagine synthetase B [Pyrinomonadaceae bacterium]
RAASRIVPREVLYRRKMGFGVPVGNWMRNVMKSFVEETMLSEKSQNRGLFKPQVVRRMVEQHVNGEKDFNQPLWTLLMLELWFQHFID